MSPDGPFADSQETCARGVPLPCEQPPELLFNHLVGVTSDDAEPTQTDDGQHSTGQDTDTIPVAPDTQIA